MVLAPVWWFIAGSCFLGPAPSIIPLTLPKWGLVSASCLPYVFERRTASYCGLFGGKDDKSQGSIDPLNSGVEYDYSMGHHGCELWLLEGESWIKTDYSKKAQVALSETNPRADYRTSGVHYLQPAAHTECAKEQAEHRVRRRTLRADTRGEPLLAE